MKSIPGDIKVCYEVIGFDDLKGLGCSFTQKDTFEEADEYAKFSNYKAVGYFDEVTLHMKLHVIKVTSEVIN